MASAWSALSLRLQRRGSGSRGRPPQAPTGRAAIRSGGRERRAAARCSSCMAARRSLARRAPPCSIAREVLRETTRRHHLLYALHAIGYRWADQLNRTLEIARDHRRRLLEFMQRPAVLFLGDSRGRWVVSALLRLLCSSRCNNTAAGRVSAHCLANGVFHFNGKTDKNHSAGAIDCDQSNSSFQRLGYYVHYGVSPVPPYHQSSSHFHAAAFPSNSSTQLMLQGLLQFSAGLPHGTPVVVVFSSLIWDLARRHEHKDILAQASTRLRCARTVRTQYTTCPRLRCPLTTHTHRRSLLTTHRTSQCGSASMLITTAQPCTFCNRRSDSSCL